MKRIWATLFACAVGFNSASACLNVYNDEVKVRMQKEVPKEVAETIARLEGEFTTNPSVEVTNDLAVAYVLAGNYSKAVELLQALEAKYPGYAKTASNLGTALELLGNNDDAIDWIKAGIKRDPNDHEGTEWLHVKILESKLWIEKDPNWLESHSVIGIDFGRNPQPRSEAEIQDQLGPQRTLTAIATALQYQLHERLRFVSMPDPLIGDLYFSWANIEAMPKENHALDYYNVALKFGAKNESLIRSRASQYALDYPAATDDSNRYGAWIVGLLGLLLAMCGAIFVDRKMRAR